MEQRLGAGGAAEIFRNLPFEMPGSHCGSVCVRNPFWVLAPHPLCGVKVLQASSSLSFPVGLRATVANVCSRAEAGASRCRTTHGGQDLEEARRIRNCFNTDIY